MESILLAAFCIIFSQVIRSCNFSYFKGINNEKEE